MYKWLYPSHGRRLIKSWRRMREFSFKTTSFFCSDLSRNEWWRAPEYPHVRHHIATPVTGSNWFKVADCKFWLVFNLLFLWIWTHLLTKKVAWRVIVYTESIEGIFAEMIFSLELLFKASFPNLTWRDYNHCTVQMACYDNTFICLLYQKCHSYACLM